MNRIALSFFLLLLPFVGPSALFAQKLIGLASAGGKDELGTILEWDLTTQTGRKVYDFTRTIPGSTPADARLVELGGKLYGVTKGGGAYNKGTLYAWDTLSHTYDSLFAFDGPNGYTPDGGLTELNGILYGTTRWGGDTAHYTGIIFSWNPATHQYTRLHRFADGSDGAQPAGTLVAHNGRLYGLADGGKNWKGVIFSWQPDSGIYRVEAHFADVALETTYGSYTLCLFQGNLCGVARDTAAQGYVLSAYCWSPDSAQFLHVQHIPYINLIAEFTVIDNKLIAFNGQGGAFGHGVFYSWNPLADTFITEVDIPVGIRGLARLTAQGQSLWGITQYVSPQDSFEIIEWNAVTDVFTHHYTFNKVTEGYPNSYLTPVGQGWYGTDHNGGVARRGRLFSWKPGTAPATVLSFSEAEACMPLSALTASQGTYYGVGLYGGTAGFGGIFSWNPETNQKIPVLDFTQLEVRGGTGHLTPLNGLLYGLSDWGGAGRNGGIYVFDPVQDTAALYLDFDSLLAVGRRPMGTLTALNGKLYGVTKEGASALETGTVFEFDPLTRAFVSLYALDSISALGASPAGDLLALDGLLYGIATQPLYADSGFIYSLNPATGEFLIRARLGKRPFGNLMLWQGKLYGTLHDGSEWPYGTTLFEWDPATPQVTPHRELPTATGFRLCPQMVVYQNEFYGIATEGGANGQGTLFRWNPATDSVNVLMDLSAEDGMPIYDYRTMGLALYDPTNSTDAVPVSQATLRVYPNPARDLVCVSLDPMLAQEPLRISDLAGHAVLSFAETGLSRAVDIALLPAGVYLVQVGQESQILVKQE